MKRSKYAYFTAIGVLFLAIILVAVLASTSKTEAPKPVSIPCVNIGSICYDLERATTNEQRIKGLSNRENLPQNKGMLFVFDSDDEQCMWMKDTLIPLDMIWLDSIKRVIKIEEKVSPDSFPKAFCPTSPARYVIELNQGDVQKNQIQIGDTIVL